MSRAGADRTATGHSSGGATVPGSRHEALLEVEHLSVELRGEHGWTTVVDDVSFEVHAGETLGLVGESGSGKTMTALGVMGLLSAPDGRIGSGSVRLEGRDLHRCSERELSDVRGRDIGIIFQEPVRSLNPAYTVGDQIAEVVVRHEGTSKRAALARAVEMLDLVGIPAPHQRIHDYPHRLSGGMAQRVMLAIALVCRPRLLIADEPTTALDVTIQAQVLRLLEDIQREMGVAILFITHDLGVVAQTCDRVAVMYAGQVVETAPVEDLFLSPRHPYTEGLLDSILDFSEHAEEFRSIRGTIPPPHLWPSGCRFHPRCDHAVAGRCDTSTPPLVEEGGGRAARCVRSDEIQLRGIDR